LEKVGPNPRFCSPLSVFARFFKSDFARFFKSDFARFFITSWIKAILLHFFQKWMI
jgi:hypothetical protein